MKYEAAIRFAPTTTVQRLSDPKWPKPQRLMYDAGSLKMLRTSVPLLVDHEEGREIGTVKSLMRLDTGDAAGPWVVAIAEVTERPSWLKRGTPASFAFVCPRYSSFGDPILRSGYVTEVSALSPGVEPVEPLAQVMYVKPIAPAPVPRAAPKVARRVRRVDEMAELRRRLDAAPPHVSFETVLAGLRADLGYPTGVR